MDRAPAASLENRPAPAAPEKEDPMRHYLPTFAKFGERRFNRPTDAYDVMYVRDSWLCAHLADEIMYKSQITQSPYLAGSAPQIWSKDFDKIMAALGEASWGASVAFYLTGSAQRPT